MSFMDDLKKHFDDLGETTEGEKKRKERAEALRNEVMAGFDVKAHCDSVINNAWLQFSGVVSGFVNQEHEKTPELMRKLAEVRKLMLSCSRIYKEDDPQMVPDSHMYLRLVDGDGDSIKTG